MLPEDSTRSLQKQGREAEGSQSALIHGSHTIGDAGGALDENEVYKETNEDEGKDDIVGLYGSKRGIAKALPEIPIGDETFDFSSIIGPSDPDEEKVKKRASNVLRLTQENQKLMAELKAMQDRLESLERAQKRRKEELLKKVIVSNENNVHNLHIDSEDNM